jgi:DsbC/DsbD-like thiol-disulfide interchange protein
MRIPIALAVAAITSVAGAGRQAPRPASAAIALFQSASSTSPAPDRSETNHLVAIASVSEPVVAPGTRLSLFLEVTPKPKMHVYAPGQKAYIPISVKLDADEAFRAHAPVFPKPEPFLFVPLNENQLVYSKPFRIVQDVTVASTPGMRARARVADAMLTIKGTMRYQACDDQVCYVPKDVPVAWTTKLQGLGK